MVEHKAHFEKGSWTRSTGELWDKLGGREEGEGIIILNIPAIVFGATLFPSPLPPTYTHIPQIISWALTRLLDQ